MTPVQERLLTMLRELVEIFDAHGLTYYAAGGTALGAIRHKGFIPWDDDVDLMMPRADWQRFVRLAKTVLPPDRELCCLELNEDYPHVFGRYVDTSTCSIHYNQFLGGTSEGLVVDIFILDPVPDAGASFAAHREALALYNDLANPLGYSYPMSSDKQALKRYAKRIAREGRRAVLAELEREVAQHDDGEYLVMRWAAAPRLFHKSIYGYRRLEQFETLQISVPSRLHDYLVQHYGDDWMYLPEQAVRAGHDAITFTDVDYRTVLDDYLPFVDVQRTRKAILRRREYHIDHMADLHSAEDLKARITATFARMATELRVAQLEKGDDLPLDAQPTGKLDWAFADLYRLQLLPELEGREEYLTIRRYYDPVPVDADERILYAALENLLRTNRVGPAARILAVHKKAHGELPPLLTLADMHVRAVRTPLSLADVGCPGEALDFARDLEAHVPGTFSNALFLAETLVRGGSLDEARTTIAAALERFPEAGELKAAEIGLKLAQASQAHEEGPSFSEYADALAHTTNALVVEGVLSAVSGAMQAGNAAADAAPDARPAESSTAASIDDVASALRNAAGHAVQEVPARRAPGDPRVAQKALDLLAELNEVCERQGIARFLGPQSCLLAARYGRNEPCLPELDLLVEADQMACLAQALDDELQRDSSRGRALDCWLTNKDYPAFMLDYVDTTSTFLQLEEGPGVSCPGVRVRVLPLRSLPVGKPEAMQRVLERGWELNSYKMSKDVSVRNVADALAARAAMAVGRKRLAKRLFEGASSERQHGEEALVRLLDGRTVSCPAAWFASPCELRLQGRAFPAPGELAQFLAACMGDDWQTRPLDLYAPYRKALVCADLPYEELMAQLAQEGCEPKGLYALMRRIRLGMIPLANDLRVRNQALRIAERSADRKRVYDALQEREAQIDDAAAKHDLDALAQLLADYEAAARRYLKHGLALVPSDRHLELLCEVLDAKGDGKTAARLRKLVPEAHRRPLGPR